ncbi:hypothetical protein [Streptomyces erythrochromogenes]|uniref:hypothetical protein n=1 Tax=Streptomyces erythrochromogenes TaxID=285574 RepID=UPI0004CDB056|nr:hypothetical protein [Streptomyces erythrochromogenes]
MGETGAGAGGEWVRLLAAYAPPHPDGDWFQCLFWPLLRAAAELPVLRGVYPSLALNCLVVHHGPDVWRSDPADRWPAVCVGSEGVYAVVSDAWSNDAEVLCETVDPVLVAVEWGKLIGVRQGSGWVKSGQGRLVGFGGESRQLI